MVITYNMLKSILIIEFMLFFVCEGLENRISLSKQEAIYETKLYYYYGKRY